MYGDCEICAESPRVDGKHFARCASGTNAKLVGGFNAHLCNECQNEWHEYVEGTPGWQALNDAKKAFNRAQVELIAKTATIAGMDAAYDAQVSALDSLYRVGKAWVEARKAANRKAEKISVDGVDVAK